MADTKTTEGLPDPAGGGLEDTSKVALKNHEDPEELRVYSDESGASLSDGDEQGQRRSGSDNDQRRKGRRKRRMKGGRKHVRRYHHPYACETTARGSEDRLPMVPYSLAPRNTTQYLIEDHVKSKISPNLSENSSSSDEGRGGGGGVGGGLARWHERKTNPAQPSAVSSQDPELEKQQDGPQDSPHLSLPFAPSERQQYDQEFVSAYDNINEDKLLTMSKEELIRVTSRLLQKVEENKMVRRRVEEAEMDRLKKSPSSTTPVGGCN